MFEQVAEESDDQSEDKRGSPGRNGVQLCADLCVAVCLYDAWREEGVAVCGDDKAKVHEAAEEDFEIFEHVEHVSWGYAAFDGRFALVFLKAGADICLFITFEPRKGVSAISVST